MSIRFAVAGSLVLARVAGAQPSPDDVLNGMDGANTGKSRAGTRDCDKAKKEQDSHLDQNMLDPQRAVFGGAKAACSYFERIAWKPPASKAAPTSTDNKDIVARTAGDFWAASDDRYQVAVVSGGTIGAWKQLEDAAVKGVPSRRVIDAYTVIVGALADDKVGCFVVYGAISQKNLAHPDKKPPAWGNPEYLASDWKRAEKLASCPKGARPPKRDP